MVSVAEVLKLMVRCRVVTLSQPWALVEVIESIEEIE